MELEMNVKVDIVLPDIPTEFKLEDGRTIPTRSMSENALRKIVKEWGDQLLTAAGHEPKKSKAEE
jgi:hypothetical protein